MSFQIRFQDVVHSDRLRQECEDLANALREEFPETSKFEVTLKHDGNDHEALVHVTGKDIDYASHAQTKKLHEAITDAFDRVRRQLRKHHDKMIFAKRRNTRP